MDKEQQVGAISYPTPAQVEAQIKVQQRRDERADKERMAIERLQAASKMSLYQYKQPLVVTTSGGKDSSVCVELARRAGIPFEVQHSHTTADAPETVYFVRREFERLEDLGIKCTVNMPMYKGRRTSMWALIPQKLMPPTRIARYCCEVLKERGGHNRFITTGVRWAESLKRKNGRGIYETSTSIKNRVVIKNDNDDRRRLFENCALKATRICNPIIDWTDADVWDFLGDAKVPVNPLYQCGFSRVGCVGCPMAGKSRYKEFARWKSYEQMYIRAFDAMIAERQRREKKQERSAWGTTGRDVFNWWMENGVLPGQMSMENYE